MKKRKSQNNGQRMLKFYATIIASMMLLGYCSEVFSSPSLRVVEDESRIMAVEEQLEQEAEFVEKLKNFAPRPVVENAIFAQVPDLDDFLALQVGPYKHRPLHIAGRDSKTHRTQLLNYIQESIKHKRELVSWECGFDTTPAGKRGEKPLIVPHIARETQAAVKNDPSLLQEHLFQIPAFDTFMPEEGRDGNYDYPRVRYRAPIVHTDLARLLYLHTYACKDGKLTHCSLNGSQPITGEMFAAYQLAAKVVNQVRKTCKNDDEVALALHDFLCNNVRYEMNMHAGANESLVVGALLRQQATSHGYARAYMLLLTMAGIENHYVTGFFKLRDMKNPVPRAWNLVRLGGSWLHVDVAADDPAPDDKSFISRSYFGLPQQLLRRTHEVLATDAREQDIEKTGRVYYFSKNKLCFDSVEKLLLAVIDNAWPKRIRCAEYCCTKANMTVEAINAALQQPSDAIKEKLESLKIKKIRLNCQPIDAHGVIRISVKLNDEVVE